MRYLLLLGGALGIPIAVYQSPNYLEKLREDWNQSQQTPAEGVGAVTEGPLGEGSVATTSELSPSQMPTEAAVSNFQQVSQRRIPDAAPLEGYTPRHLGEIFRFNVHPNWVYQHWQRKKMIPASQGVYGIRVPLVTGTSVDSLAGALTYYFNNAGGVEWITFRGRTGNTTPLIRLLVQQYAMQPQVPQVSGEQWYETRWNGRPVSRLRIAPQPVIWSQEPRNSFDVDLHLERPGSTRFRDDRPLLTAEQQQALQQRAEEEAKRAQAEVEQVQQQAQQAKANADKAEASRAAAEKQLQEARAAADKNLQDAREAVRRAEEEARKASAAQQAQQDLLQDAWQRRQQPLDWLRGQIAPLGGTPSP